MNIVKAAMSATRLLKQITHKVFGSNNEHGPVFTLKGKELKLSGALIEDAEAKSLAASLERSRVQAADLRDNLISDEGVEAIAIAIKKCKTLKVLDLSENDFGDEGALALAEAVKSSPIEKLDLRHNAIGNRGVEALVEALNENQNIKMLDLRGNYISSEFTEAFKENPALRL